jgi:hypothetical protein
MGVEPDARGATETAGFRLHGWRGDGLPEREREPWRQQFAALVLADELAGHASFWRDVLAIWTLHEEVRDERAWEVAGRYARRRRRRVVARLLGVAADAPDDASARTALCMVGVRAVAVIEDGPPVGRPRRYRTTAGLDARVRDGARALAWRGDGRCMACGAKVAAAAWCQPHGGSTIDAQLTRGKVERDLRWAVDYAAPAILREPTT